MGEELKAEIIKAVKAELGIEKEVLIDEVQKNNGVVYQSLVINTPGKSVCPVIYIDEFLMQIKTGETSVQNAAQQIVSIYKAHDDTSLYNIIGGLDKKSILDKVIYQIINAKMNKDRLVHMIHKEVLDLAVIYRVMLKQDESGSTSMVLNDAFCKMYDISKEELDAAARRNLVVKGFKVKSVNSILEEVTGFPEELMDSDCPLWVLTTNDMYNGAAVMLYNECFASLADQLGDDLYVLPSSIHEVIAVPVKLGNPDILKSMVRFVNISDVLEEEKLSDNVYRYSREKGELQIVQ